MGRVSLFREQEKEEELEEEEEEGRRCVSHENTGERVSECVCVCEREFMCEQRR